MPSLKGRMFGGGLLVGAALSFSAGDAVGEVGTPVLQHLLVSQVTAPPSAGVVTYSPMRRPGATTPPVGIPPVSPSSQGAVEPSHNPSIPVAPTPAIPAPIAPTYAAPIAPARTAPVPGRSAYGVPAPVVPALAVPVPVAPASAASAHVAPTHAVPAPVAPASATPSWPMPAPYSPTPLPLPSALQPGRQSSPFLGTDAGPDATVFAKASRPTKPAYRYFGLSSDIGMPDGLNLGLVFAPADWLRLGASLGTNSASLGYRGGLSILPVGWGPSFSLEVGHCNTAATTSTIRAFFTVPSWVRSYVQQLGYTYVNAHVGFDYRIGGFTLFVHGGYTYLMGTIRSPDPVVVDSQTKTSIQIAQDGNVTVYTLSAKAGLIYMFGGR